MLSNEAQQSLPPDAQVALQQVDNCKYSYPNTASVCRCRRLLKPAVS